MPTIDTVRGPVSTEQLGTVLPHEHIFTKNPEIEQNWPSPEWDGDEVMIDRAATSLNELKELGIDSMVDLTVPGIGRNIPLIQRVAAKTDVNIIVGTGYYIFDALPNFFKTHSPEGHLGVKDPLADMFIRDITEGIAETGVKASIIKVATDTPGITPDVERVLAAAAEAHRQTGAPITTHTHADEFRGRDQQEYFRQQGIPLEHVLIGHCGDSTDIGYLRELMDNGSTLGLDRFGMEIMLEDEKRVETTVRLIELGYAERLTLSHDAGIFSVNLPPSYRNRVMPNWHYKRISQDILPALRERGVSDADIHQITVVNPARVLAGAR